ncbi:MAG: ComEC family competence protein [Firmicutes bacterium]|nr:ComEC family competence protein [Bacillota bacterium]
MKEIEEIQIQETQKEIISQKHRYINFRAIFVVALFIISSILFGFLTFVLPVLGWILFIIWFSFALVCATYFWIKKKSLKKTITFIISAICSVAVFLNFIVFVNINNQSHFQTGEVIRVTGSVDDVLRLDGETVLILTNLNHEGESVRGNMRLSVRNVPKEGSVLSIISPGSQVTVSGVAHFNRIIDDNLNISSRVLRTGIRYRMNVNYDTQHIYVVPQRANWYRRFTMRVQANLFENLGEDYGALAWGMLTGDRSGLSDDIRFNFQNSGLGHVMAVSGLHLALVAGILFFILNKLKIRRWYAHIVITVVLFLYMFFASFSPSVVRAFIMLQVFLVGQNTGLCRDSLSSLSLAASVMLLIFPLYLFDPGFMMSIGAVYAIMLFSRHFTKFFKEKLRLPRRAAQFLSVTISAQMGVMPAMIMHFSQFHTYAILTNIVLMPVFMFSYILVFISTVLSTIMPFLGFALRGSGFILRLIDTVAAFFAHLPFAAVVYFSTSLIALVYVGYFFLSRFFMQRQSVSLFKNARVVSDRPIEPTNIINDNSVASVANINSSKKCSVKFFAERIGIVRPLAVILIIFAFLNGLIFYPRLPLNNAIIPVNNFSCVTSVVVYNNEVNIIGDLRNFQRTRTILRNHRFSRVNDIFLTELTERNAIDIVHLSREFRPNRIFVSYNAMEMDAMALLMQNNIDFHSFNTNNYRLILPQTMTPIFRESDGNFLAFEKSTDYANILFIGYNANYHDLTYDIINRASIIRTFAFTVAFRHRIFITNFRIWQVDVVIEPDYNFSLVDYNDMLFNFQIGKLVRISHIRER